MGEDRLSQALLTFIEGQKAMSWGGPVPKGGIVAAVGGGGKTSVLFALAEASSQEGGRVCLTTTTHIYDPRTETEARPFNRVVLVPELADKPMPPRDAPFGTETYENPLVLPMGSPSELLALSPGVGSITVLASRDGIPDTSVYQPERVSTRPLLKLGGIHPEQVPYLRAIWDLILVEADGSKHLPIKAPADHEPVLPPATDVVIGCIGLDCLGKPLDERSVHRPALFSTISGCGKGELLSFQHLINLVNHPQGLFKAVPGNTRRVLLMNKADVLSEETVLALQDHVSRIRSQGELLVVLGSAQHDRVFWTLNSNGG